MKGPLRECCPSHVEDPHLEACLVEQGRALASEREDLIATGIDPADLEIPIGVLKATKERHPEEYCHRCGGPNISWYTPGGIWDPVMRPIPGEPWKWNEIICPTCFVELADGGTWALLPTHLDGEPWTSADERAAIIARAKAEAVSETAAEVERLREALLQAEGERDDLDTGAGELLGENVELAAELAHVKAESHERLIRLQRRERDEADRLAEEASKGDTGICRTCAQPITYETVEEHGYKPRTGWSDGARVDALVCFKAVDYRHVPLVGRERGIWDAATKAAATESGGPS